MQRYRQPLLVWQPLDLPREIEPRLQWILDDRDLSALRLNGTEPSEVLTCPVYRDQ
jgi:hypothetical protein